MMVVIIYWMEGASGRTIVWPAVVRQNCVERGGFNDFYPTLTTEVF